MHTAAIKVTFPRILATATTLMILSAPALSQSFDGRNVMLGHGGTTDTITPIAIGGQYFSQPIFGSVTSAIEFPDGSLLTRAGNVVRADIDVSSSSLILQATSLNGFNDRFGFYFSGNPGIANVAINPASTFAPADLQFSSSAITFLAANYGYGTIIYDVQFAPIPEPSIVAMLLVALPCVLAISRRRGRSV